MTCLMVSPSFVFFVDTITGKMREMQSVADDLNERADKRAVRLAGEVVLSVGSKTVWHGLVEGMIAWKVLCNSVTAAVDTIFCFCSIPNAANILHCCV